MSGPADPKALANLVDGLTPDHADRLIQTWRGIDRLAADIASRSRDDGPLAPVIPLFDRSRRRHPSARTRR